MQTKNKKQKKSETSLVSLHSHSYTTHLPFDSPAPMPKAITDADFAKDVLQSKMPVVVDFWAPWCGPCKAMNPILEQLATDLEGKITFVKMNVDENNEIPQQFNVMSIPTFVIFKEGKPVKSIIGSKSKEDFRKEVEAAIA